MLQYDLNLLNKNYKPEKSKAVKDEKKKSYEPHFPSYDWAQ